MEKGRFRLRVWLVAAGLCLPPAVAVGDTASASASARITLYIAPRAQLRSAGESGAQSLCLRRLPARRVRMVFADAERVARDLVLESGGACIELPAAVSNGGHSILIVAQ